MIVNVSKKSNNRCLTFGDLPIGTAFHWRDWFYIKTDECSLRGTELMYSIVVPKNAVQLENGHLAHFNNGDEVERIPMSVEVYE